MSPLSLSKAQALPRPFHAFGPEFFAPLPLLTVAAFALNNLFFKEMWPGWFTGKLSDITVCFFLPLFFSALVDAITGLASPLSYRIVIGAALTLLLFVPLKIDADWSAQLTRLGNQACALLGLPPSSNRADPTDLLAVPFVGLAVLYARRSGREFRRPAR